MLYIEMGKTICSSHCIFVDLSSSYFASEHNVENLLLWQVIVSLVTEQLWIPVKVVKDI